MAHPSIPDQIRALSQAITVIRYKGFLLIEQENKSWLIRPESSPLVLLPFRTNVCSLIEAQKLLDKKLSNKEQIAKAA